jgi:hypothetical protein
MHHGVDTAYGGRVVARLERAGDDELELPRCDERREDGRVERGDLGRGAEGTADGPAVAEECVGDMRGELLSALFRGMI